MEANTKKVCKWCGKPEATEEGPCVPVDAFCWAAVNMDYCEEGEPECLLERALAAEARVKELEAALAAKETR